MRLSALIVTVLLITSTAFAQTSRPARRVLKKKSGPSSSVSSSAPSVSSRESSLRKLGVVPFVAKGFSADQADRLTKQFVNDLTAMSYFQATFVSASPGKAERAQLSSALSSAGLDGAIIAEVAPDRVVGQILSRSGETLKVFTVNRDVLLGSDAQVKDVSRAMVEEIASTVPYRGFITRPLPEGLYEINLGKNQGIVAGQRFRVFDFEGGTFNSAKVDKGEIQIVQVGDSTSSVESTGADLKPFYKIGFNEQAHGMSTAEQVETRGYVTVGGGILNISGTGDPRYVDRAYNISSTPAFALGGRWKKFEIDVLIAQARGDDTDFVYNEVIADYQIVDQPFGGLNRFSVWAGGRLARVGITTSKNIVSALQSTTSISPEVSARVDRIIKGPVKGFLAASAYFPIFVSGMDTGALLFSYGIGGDAGLSLDFSQRVFMDVGARYHLIRRPVEGQTSVQETYTEIFGQLGYRF